MFSRRSEPAEPRKVITVVGADTKVEGTISGSGSIRVDGQVRGEIRISGDLTVGDKGAVDAKVLARNVVVAGELRGTVEATGKLEMAPTGKLYGQVSVSSLIVDDGAVFKGTCDMVRGDESGPKLLPGSVASAGGDQEPPGEPTIQGEPDGKREPSG